MFSLCSRTGLYLACLAPLLISCFATDEVDTAANTVTIRGNDTSVLIQGGSGKISTLHFEQDDDDDDDDKDDNEKEDFGDDNEDILTFQVESLQEVNAAGGSVGLQESLKHGISSLASQTFTFTPLENSTTYQGIPVKRVNLSTSVLSGQQANLRLIVMVFLRAGTIDFGNETFTVQSGTMKFNIEVSDWPFCGVSVNCTSQNNQQEFGQFLDLKLGIKSQAEEPEEEDDAKRAQSNKPAICVDPDEPNEKDDDCPIIYNMGGNSEMVLNRGVLTDNGNYVAMPTGFPKFETTGMMSKRLVFRIPKFNNTVILDPSVNVGASTKKQGNGTGHNSASSVQFFSLALFSSFLIVYHH